MKYNLNAVYLNCFAEISAGPLAVSRRAVVDWSPTGACAVRHLKNCPPSSSKPFVPSSHRVQLESGRNAVDPGSSVLSALTGVPAPGPLFPATCILSVFTSALSSLVIQLNYPNVIGAREHLCVYTSIFGS